MKTAMPTVHARSWHPTFEQFTGAVCELKHNKAPDVGGWTTESAKRLSPPYLPPLWGAWLTRSCQGKGLACTQARLPP